MFSPLLLAGLNKVLNHILYRDRALKAARQRLAGRSLALNFEGVATPIILLFSEQHLNVVSNPVAQADCTVSLKISTVKKILERQQLTRLIRSGELDVEGDLQVIQHFSALIELAELDPAEYLAPWVGDIVANGLGKAAKTIGYALMRDLHLKQRYFSEAVTEEWRLAPGELKVTWFEDEVNALANRITELEQRLNKMEAR